MPTGVYERTSAHNNANSAANKGRKFSPEHCAALSAGKTGKKHSPERCAINSAAHKGVPLSQEHRDAISRGQKSSEDRKIASGAMLGGDDIVWHHTLYDHADLSKNRVAMTRSNHTMGHNVLRELGIVIPHINISEEVNNG